MDLEHLNIRDFDHMISVSENAARQETIRADEAFALALARAVRKGRERAKPGTFIDTTPHYGARRYYGDVAMSPCGSPAAMCTEASGAPSGAQSLK
jgi:hypothetical protein